MKLVETLLKAAISIVVLCLQLMAAVLTAVVNLTTIAVKSVNTKRYPPRHSRRGNGNRRYGPKKGGRKK